MQHDHSTTRRADRLDVPAPAPNPSNALSDPRIRHAIRRLAAAPLVNGVTVVPSNRPGRKAFVVMCGITHIPYVTAPRDAAEEDVAARIRDAAPFALEAGITWRDLAAGLS